MGILLTADNSRMAVWLLAQPWISHGWGSLAILRVIDKIPHMDQSMRISISQSLHALSQVEQPQVTHIVFAVSAVRFFAKESLLASWCHSTPTEQALCR